MTPVTTHLTTLRGRGGWTSSNQKLFDVFWMMTTSLSNANAVATLNHFLITPAGAAIATDDSMNVNYGFPLNVW